MWLLRRSNVIMLLPSLLIAYGLLLLFVGLTGITEELKSIIDYPELALGIVVLIPIVLVYWIIRFIFRSERREIRKAFKKDYESAYKMIEELAEQEKDQYPVVQMIKSKAGELFSNRTIALLVLLLVVTLFFAFSEFSAVDEDTTSQKTAFSIVNIDEQDYVITYVSGTTYFLNQAEVNYEENAIAISTTNQRVIVSEDMRYEVVRFESVKIEKEQKG